MKSWIFYKKSTVMVEKKNQGILSKKVEKLIKKSKENPEKSKNVSQAS